eukprot:2134572-Alexandrium_andersonii.AAC.1
MSKAHTHMGGWAYESGRLSVSVSASSDPRSALRSGPRPSWRACRVGTSALRFHDRLDIGDPSAH